MICLRCGYCCLYYAVVLPDGTFYDGNGTGCKNLRWDNAKASCSVHGQDAVLEGETYSWEETPCGRHGQIERSEDAPCRIGKHVLRKTDVAQEG